MKTTFISSQTFTSMVILELSCYLQTGYLLRMLTDYESLSLLKTRSLSFQNLVTFFTAENCS